MDVLLPLARNTTLLVSLAFVYTLFIPSLRRLPETVQDYSIGLVFGIFAILTVLDSVATNEIILFDARYVILMLAAMLAGWRGGLIACLITGLFCWFLNDVNLSAQYSAMLTSIAIGGMVYYRYQGEIPAIWVQLLTGVVLAFVPLFWALVLPYDYNISPKTLIIATYVILFPLTVIILMQMLAQRYAQLALNRELMISQKRQEAIFQQTPLAILFMTPDGVLEDLNDAMQMVMGLDKRKVIGKHYSEINWLWTDETTRRLTALIEVAQTGDFIRSTFEFEREGENFVLDASFLPLKDDDQKLSLIVIEAHNITNEIGSKQNQLALQFERERNQILQDLIADASHHLRTPLAIIGSSTYLIRRQLQQTRTSDNTVIDDKIQNQFERLENARIDLNDIVEDLLNLMRLDNASQYHFKEVDLIRFIRETVQTYHALAESHQQTLTVVMPDTPIQTQIIPDVLRRVVQNLIENALRYTPEHGTIIVTLKQMGMSVIFEVCDTGIGIPADDLPRIFDRFYRAGNALAQSRKGTGLGLAIAKKVVELHKGTISIESEVNRGTTFTVSLPITRSTVSITD